MHSRNRDGIFASRCSSRHKSFSAARHQHWNAPRATFQCREFRLRLSTTYGIPDRFDVVIDGKRKPARSIWRTCTEIGVIFSDAPQRSAEFIQNERDIAPLLELLKMAAERWPSSDGAIVPESELLKRDQALLDMWPEACRRTGIPVHEFPIGVIKRWQQEMGWPN